jgi:hypothetical protein
MLAKRRRQLRPTKDLTGIGGRGFGDWMSSLSNSMPTSLQAVSGRAEGRPGKSANRSQSTLNNELIFLYLVLPLIGSM